MFQQITIQQLSHYFGNQSETVCFEDFSGTIHSGDRIALIGQNGSGKSTLLKILNQEISPHKGEIMGLESLHKGYVPQIIEDLEDLSGAERFQKALSLAIASEPEMLLLDEPTNHLDPGKRLSLKRMLNHYTGILVIASHDLDLIQSITDIIWHIDNGHIRVFHGGYSEYYKVRENEYQKLNKALGKLKRDKCKAHENLMREQQSYKHRKAYGKKRYAGDKLTLSSKKREGLATTAKKQKMIVQSKKTILDALDNIKLPALIKPTFYIEHASKIKENVLQVSQASCGYKGNCVLENIALSLSSHEKIALQGDNGSGKSTLIKALLNEQCVEKMGYWHICHRDKIGYLDQHYHNIDLEKSVLDNILNVRNEWDEVSAYRHLNDFLFRKYHDIHKLSRILSGGEKCRLSLAIIAAKMPALLILDEVTNNLDLDTKAHVVNVLNQYPGAMIVISHESYFLTQLNLDKIYFIKDKRLRCE